MKRSILLTIALLATIAVTAFASMNPTGVPEWLLQRSASKVSIDKSGGIHLDPRSGQNVTIEAGDALAYSATNYSGTSSFQPVAIDLNLGTAAGSTGGKFISPGMGNVLGANLTKAGNYVGGWIGYYSITGTNASTYPKAGLIGGVTDGTTTANCAVCAVLDGDSALTTARAAFGVFRLNSTPGSGFDYGVDLFRATHDGYPALGFLQSDIRFSSGARLSLLTGTASLDFTALAGNTCEEFAITVTGAADGDPVSLGVPAAAANVDNKATFTAFVSAPDTVLVRRCNPTAGATADPAAATVRANVSKP